MATDKPRFSITVSDDVYQQINAYQHEHRLPTQTKAVLAFIEKGLEVIQNEKKPLTGLISVESIDSVNKISPPYVSETEEHLITLHRKLNAEGQEKLLDYADDLVASGKYIKSDPNNLGKTKEA